MTCRRVLAAVVVPGTIVTGGFESDDERLPLETREWWHQGMGPGPWLVVGVEDLGPTGRRLTTAPFSQDARFMTWWIRMDDTLTVLDDELEPTYVEGKTNGTQ